ncbi:hypothetical protein [Arachidicoccus terrestris]|uniref:hypothetical protein n=1 Tax=Arachidicoccus terrestris TaxID=2875539 RepID=UPI001CC7494F|nr:hypothetical protein [Arachidicoccus terrestris]UAY56783.1 hypothetical protein K9M52_07275 [Arachidicoccus terrestris]
MQDLKNNAGQTDRDHGRQDENEPHPFDRQVRRHLEDAEITPPADLMDKIFGLLEEDPTKQVAPAAPVKPLRRFRRRLSNVAAIAGVLVVLAIGMRELTRQDSVVVVPAGRPAVQSPLTTPVTPEPQPSKDAKKKTNAAKTGMMDGTPGPEAEKTAAPVVTAGTARHNTKESSGRRSAGRPTAITKPSGSDQNTALVAAKAQPVQADKRPAGSEAHLAVTQDIAVKKASADQALTAQIKPQRKVAAASAVDRQEDTRNTAMTAGTADKNEVAKTAVIADIAPRGDNEGDALARADGVSKQGRTDHAERRGLLKGIFKKIGNTARAITEEVVSQDEDKTVINVGVLAITAYK